MNDSSVFKALGAIYLTFCFVFILRRHHIFNKNEKPMIDRSIMGSNKYKAI